MAVALLDLHGHRCPTMQIKLRRGLTLFAQSTENNLLVKSVEPRLLENLQEWLAHHPELALSIKGHQTESMHDGKFDEWAEAGHSFDREDVGDIDTIQLVLVSRTDNDNVR